MFFPTRTVTACQVFLPFLIRLYPTRISATYTHTTSPPSLDTVLYDNVGDLLLLHSGPTQYIYIYICITAVFSSTSRLFNVLSYRHVNSMAALLAILDMSTCYHSSASGMRQNVVQKVPKRCSTPQSKPWHSEGCWLSQRQNGKVRSAQRLSTLDGS